MPEQRNRQLAYTIAPRSGPLRVVSSLRDANHALTQDLPISYFRRPHWKAAGWQLVRAVETGSWADILVATESLLQAVITEGWMNREPACESDKREPACGSEKRDQELQTTIEALTKRLRQGPC